MYGFDDNKNVFLLHTESCIGPKKVEGFLCFEHGL